MAVLLLLQALLSERGILCNRFLQLLLLLFVLDLNLIIRHYVTISLSMYLACWRTGCFLLTETWTAKQNDATEAALSFYCYMASLSDLACHL